MSPDVDPARALAAFVAKRTCQNQSRPLLAKSKSEAFDENVHKLVLRNVNVGYRENDARRLSAPFGANGNNVLNGGGATRPQMGISSKINPGTPMARLRRKTHERSQSNSSAGRATHASPPNPPSRDSSMAAPGATFRPISIHSKSSSLGTSLYSSKSKEYLEEKPAPPPKPKPRRSRELLYRATEATSNNQSSRTSSYSDQLASDLSTQVRISGTTEMQRASAGLQGPCFQLKLHTPKHQSQVRLRSKQTTAQPRPHTTFYVPQSQTFQTVLSQPVPPQPPPQSQKPKFHSSNKNLPPHAPIIQTTRNLHSSQPHLVSTASPTQYYGYAEPIRMVSNPAKTAQHQPILMAQVAPSYRTPLCARPIAPQNKARPHPQIQKTLQTYHREPSSASPYSKPVYVWTETDCCGWVNKVLGQDVGQLYQESFRQHAIDGKCLLKLTSEKIENILGVQERAHRDCLVSAIAKLRMKTHHDEFKSYEFQSMYYLNNALP